MLIALLTGALALGVERPAQNAGPPAPPAPTATEPQQSEPRPSGLRFVWNDRPSLRAGSVLRIDFIGKFQWDARRPGDDPPSFESTEIQRARVGIEGEFLDHFQFSVEHELTERELETSRTSKAWKDVYFEINYTDAAQVRIGKFKVPFGRDQLTGISNLDFIYRSLGSMNLAPARDIGVMVHGDIGNRVSYWTGVFRQDGENARTQKIRGADETGAVRLVVAPFRRPGASVLDQLDLGTGVTVSSLSNVSELPNGLRGRTIMSRYVFFEPVFVSGRRQRVGVDAEWRWAPLGVRAEYIDVRDTREGQGFFDNDLPTARARAWYVSGAYVITGDRKNWPVTPRRELARGGAGAVELVGRYERLSFDGLGGQDEAFRHPRADTILPSGDRVLTWGVNWYVNRWVKLQLHAMREQLEDPERHPRADGAAFWNTMFRLQCAL